MHLTLSSDVPFGRFEVPVAITTATDVRHTWVEVVDGAARVELPVRGTPLRVEIDPDGLLPLRGAQVAREGEVPTEERRKRADRNVASR